jgi:hypothetical protein
VTNATPPGWYPDPWKHAEQRFWDGAQWTDRTSGAERPAQRPRVSDGTPVYGVLIWILALLPLLNGIGVWFVHIDAGRLAEFLRQVQQSANAGPGAPTPRLNPLSVYGPLFWVTPVLGWGGYIAALVLAYVDEKRLGLLGVVRPFSWGWAFLTNAVYVIGRSVVVRKVAAPRGLGPVWVIIAAYVASWISVGAWAELLLGDIARHLGAFGG